MGEGVKRESRTDRLGGSIRAKQVLAFVDRAGGATAQLLVPRGPHLRVTASTQAFSVVLKRGRIPLPLQAAGMRALHAAPGRKPSGQIGVRQTCELAGYVHAITKSGLQSVLGLTWSAGIRTGCLLGLFCLRTQASAVRRTQSAIAFLNQGICRMNATCCV